MAEVCCTCPKCGELSDRYVGTHDKLCCSCKYESAWNRVVENLERAIDEYTCEARHQNRREPALAAKIAKLEAMVNGSRRHDEQGDA